MGNRHVDYGIEEEIRQLREEDERERRREVEAEEKDRPVGGKGQESLDG